MNLNNVAKREILDFTQFRGKVHDENFKPLSPQNQTGDNSRSGISAIKREPAFDFAGYADSVFANRSKINYAGLNIRDPRSGKLSPYDLTGIGTPSGGGLEIGTELSESEISSDFRILRIYEY
jgi:hypothetical protein